ncbi:MAG: hypothetical protein V4559_08940 [Pseudomonadota bacterium]
MQGFAVLEKHDTNPHIHLLLRCQDGADQSDTAEFLLEVLDNVPKDRKDLRDERWQKDTWGEILKRGGRGPDLMPCRKSSMLTNVAPAGTAMVQIVRHEDDLGEVARYMTKTWSQSQHRLAGFASDVFVEQSTDWKFLDEFHASVDPSRIARQDRFDRITGALKPRAANASWKTNGVRIQSSRN